MDFLAITGPTTSGKTKVSLLVAERLGGEIVSMDSRQIYRRMDIGTDKASRSDRQQVPHFGIDIRDPSESYSAGEFSRDSRIWIADIARRGSVPLLVGGTGFFLRALTHPIFDEPSLDSVRRGRLRAFLDDRAAEELSRWVSVIEPDRAEALIAGGPQRMGRALEVALLTGRTLGWWHEASPGTETALEGLVVRLTLSREELVRRIDARVDKMVERGFVEEVRGLVADGCPPDSPGMTGTGYREVAAYLRGEMALDAALDEMKRQTRAYAKRQETWFRTKLPDDAVHVDASLEESAVVATVIESWNERARNRRGVTDG